MTSKVPTLLICWKKPIWVPLICRFSSVACASHCAQTVVQADSSRSNLSDFDSAVGFLRKELHPDRLSRVVDTIPNQFSADEIFKWASHQKNLKHTAMNYAQIILRLGLVSCLEEMENFLMEMVKVELSRDEVEKALSFLIRAFCRNRKTTEALCVFQVASLGNFRVEISVYNVLLSSLVAERGNFEHVVFVYKEMVKGGVLPDVETLNCLIEVLLEVGQVESAIGQFHRMDKKGCVPNSQTFKLLLTDLCLRDRIDESIEILAKMFKINCKPNGDFYYSTIPLFCKCGRLEVGTKLLRMMISSGLLPDPQLLGTLIRYLCEDAQVDNAVRLFHEVRDMDTTHPFEIYMDVVLGYCKVGRSADALDFLEKSQSYYVEPYNILLKVYCEASKFAEASALLKKMRKLKVINDVSWSILINGLFRNGHVQRASMVLGGLIVSSCMPSEATLSAFICSQCRMLQYENALLYFQEVVVKNWSLDSISYNELVHGLCNLKRFEEATDVVSYMSAKGGTLNGSLFNLLTSSFCHMDKVTKAINLHSLAFCNGVCESIDTFAVIMSYLLDHKKLNHVLAFLSRIFVEGHSLDTGTYCLLIRGLCAESMTREIIILFDQMISDGLFPDSECFDTLLSFMSKNSQVHLITLSLSKVLEKGMINSTSYNTIISCLLEEGYRDEACRFLDIMLEMGWFPDAQAHGLLVDHVNKHKENKVIKDVDDDRVIRILAEGLQHTSS